MSLLGLMTLSTCADLVFAIAENPRASAGESSLSVMDARTGENGIEQNNGKEEYRAYLRLIFVCWSKIPQYSIQ